jgi:hypothetical protein
MRKRPFFGLLLKRMDIFEAPSRGLRAALAADPDESDMIAHLKEELEARWRALDEFFSLDGKATDIWQQRTRALIEHEFGVRPNDPDWCKRLAVKMACHLVPGFSVRNPGQRRRGGPREWTNQRLAQLFADVEYLKRTTRKSVQEICRTLLRKGPYARRWGIHRPEALRKAYSTANKLRRESLAFAAELSELAATRPNAIDVAIELHSLKS